MIKKSFYGFIVFLICFMFVSSVNAYKCEYEGTFKSGDSFWANFDIESESVTPSVDFKGNNGEWDYISNWKYDEFGSGVNGMLYAKAGNCPEKIIYVHFKSSWSAWFGGQDIYITDEENFETTLNNLKAKDLQDYATGTIVKQPENIEKPDLRLPTSCKDFSENGLVDPSSLDISSGNNSCKQNEYFSCMWVETENGGYCNVNELQYIKCGDAFDIPQELPKIISFVINFLKIVTPLILIVVSIIDLVKALAASKDDEIKKVQNTLVRRIIAAVLIFFIITIVQFIIGKVAEDDQESLNVSDCLTCFINGDCEGSKYYKTNIKGLNICTAVDGSMAVVCDDNN